MADDKLLAELRALRDRLEKSTLLIEECHRRISELEGWPCVTRWNIALIYKLPDWPKGQSGEVKVGVIALTALDATNDAIAALKAELPDAIVTGSRAKVMQDRKDG